MVNFLLHHPDAPNMPHPYMAAAGVLGFGIHNASLVADIAPSILITPSITLNGRTTPAASMLREYRGGLIYGEPWHDPGVNWVGRRCTPAWAEWEIPVFVSLDGDDADVLTAARELDQVEGVAGFEVAFAGHTPLTEEQIARIRQRINLPLFIKLPPLAPNTLTEYLAICQRQHIDAVTLCGAPAVAHGRIVHPSHIATTLHAIQTLIPQTTLPIIGCGGVHDVESAHAYQSAGCVAVQIGSWLLRNPLAIHEIQRSR